MRKAFIVYATVICLVFIYASTTGWTVSDSLTSGKWNPQGKSAYHK